MATTTTNRVPVTIARILLGLIFFAFGLNYFVPFIPQTGPAPSGTAGAFVGGLFQSGYFFPFLKTIETLSGLFLLLGLFVPLVLVILMPICLNIFFFHAMLAPGPMPIGIALLILVLELYLAWTYRNYYRQLFIPRAPY